jgi:hypothetical protein
MMLDDAVREIEALAPTRGSLRAAVERAIAQEAGEVAPVDNGETVDNAPLADTRERQAARFIGHPADPNDRLLYEALAQVDALTARVADLELKLAGWINADEVAAENASHSLSPEAGMTSCGLSGEDHPTYPSVAAKVAAHVQCPVDEFFDGLRAAYAVDVPAIEARAVREFAAWLTSKGYDIKYSAYSAAENANEYLRRTLKGDV